jgi:hypothetical protein
LPRIGPVEGRYRPGWRAAELAIPVASLLEELRALLK